MNSSVISGNLVRHAVHHSSRVTVDPLSLFIDLPLGYNLCKAKFIKNTSTISRSNASRQYLQSAARKARD